MSLHDNITNMVMRMIHMRWVCFFNAHDTYLVVCGHDYGFYTIVKHISKLYDNFTKRGHSLCTF